MRRRHRAGDSDLRRWKELRRETIHRDWWLWTRLVIVLLGLCAGLPFVRGYGRLLLAGAIGAGLMTLFVGWKLGGDAHSLTWLWGRAGELETDDALKALGDEWRVVPDIRHEYGNWDHVVVGPPGIFLLETKAYRDSARIDGDGLRIGRKVFFDGKVFRTAARGLYDRLASARPVYVQATVVIWGEFAESEHFEDRVEYLAGPRLVGWLEAQQPKKLSSTRISELADAVEALRPGRARRWRARRDPASKPAFN
jgi:hypothetical protein